MTDLILEELEETSFPLSPASTFRDSFVWSPTTDGDSRRSSLTNFDPHIDVNCAIGRKPSDIESLKKIAAANALITGSACTRCAQDNLDSDESPLSEKKQQYCPDCTKSFLEVYKQLLSNSSAVEDEGIISHALQLTDPFQCNNRLREISKNGIGLGIFRVTDSKATSSNALCKSYLEALPPDRSNSHHGILSASQMNLLFDSGYGYNEFRRLSDSLDRFAIGTQFDDPRINYRQVYPPPRKGSWPYATIPHMARSPSELWSFITLGTRRASDSSLLRLPTNPSPTRRSYRSEVYSGNAAKTLESELSKINIHETKDNTWENKFPNTNSLQGCDAEKTLTLKIISTIESSNVSNSLVKLGDKKESNFFSYTTNNTDGTSCRPIGSGPSNTQCSSSRYALFSQPSYTQDRFSGWSRGYQDDDDDGNDSNEEGSQRYGRNYDGNFSSLPETQRLDCPLRKARPTENDCTDRGFQGVTRTAEHIKRKHVKNPKTCLNCWKEHGKNFKGDCKPSKPNRQFLPDDVFEKLSNWKKPYGGDEVSGWRGLYCTVIGVDSCTVYPYFEASLRDQFVQARTPEEPSNIGNLYQNPLGLSYFESQQHLVSSASFEESSVISTNPSSIWTEGEHYHSMGGNAECKEMFEQFNIGCRDLRAIIEQLKSDKNMLENDKRHLQKQNEDLHNDYTLAKEEIEHLKVENEQLKDQSRCPDCTQYLSLYLP